MSGDKITPTVTLGTDKKRKPEVEEISKDYKKPRKSLKQLTFDVTKPTKKEEGEVIYRSRGNERNNKPEWDPTEAITRIEAAITRIIDRQGTAQACLDRLLEIFSREVAEDSSTDAEVPIKEYKAH